MKNNILLTCLLVLGIMLVVIASNWLKQPDLHLKYYENLSKNTISDADFKRTLQIHEDCFGEVRKKNMVGYWLPRLQELSPNATEESLVNKIEQKEIEVRLNKETTFRYTEKVQVLKNGNKIIGLYNCEEEDILTPNYIMIYNVCIAPPSRGKGYGKFLMENAIKQCSRTGKGLSLLIEKENLRAQKLYEKLGFRLTKPPRPFPDSFPYFNKKFMTYLPSK